MFSLPPLYLNPVLVHSQKSAHVIMLKFLGKVGEGIPTQDSAKNLGPNGRIFHNRTFSLPPLYLNPVLIHSKKSARVIWPKFLGKVGEGIPTQDSPKN